MSSRTFGYVKFALVCVAVLVVLTAIQPCNAVMWSGSNSNGYYSWANGSSTDELFGTPVSDTEDTMIFEPSLNFEAVSIDETPGSISSTLEFELSAATGFQSILFSASGDYDIDDTGVVNVTGLLQVENLGLGGGTSSGIFSFTLDSPNPGTWQGSAQVTIPQTNWTHIKVIFTNTLSATTEYGSIASIANRDSAATVIVPEPATICLLGIGVLSLFRRKK